jgi:hypothetical protein
VFLVGVLLRRGNFGFDVNAVVPNFAVNLRMKGLAQQN